MEEQQKGREISLPASHCNDLPCLLEHAHDLVNDAEQDQVIIIIIFKRTKGIGMCVEGGELAGQIRIDQVSPVTTTAGP